MNVKLHTGCSCIHCRGGKNKVVRKLYHRKLRRLQNKQLRQTGDVKDATISIGYTD